MSRTTNHERKVVIVFDILSSPNSDEAHEPVKEILSTL